MNIWSFAGTLGLAALLAAGVRAQVPVAATRDHAQMLASADARLAANKRLVHDYWREVFEAGHIELAPKHTTTWFDMFRIEEGKIAGHWNPATKRP